MKEKQSKISIKNMVCNRCIKVVSDELLKHNIEFNKVDLGVIYLSSEIFKNKKQKISQILQKEGFELIESKELQIVNQVKTIVINFIHNKAKKEQLKKFSDALSSTIGIDYSRLSKIFSSIEKRSIENYVIAQKIERAKELLIYNELSLSEISYELNYSSPQHLSRQFKQVTGLTPTVFKKLGARKKLDTI